MEAPESFADVLTALRLDRGLSQSRLAHAAGVDHSYVSRLEVGRRRPARRAALALAEALGLGPAERDRLLLAGGFRPLDDGHLFADEPALAAVIGLLRGPATPAWVAADLRRELRRLEIRYARLVAA